MPRLAGTCWVSAFEMSLSWICFLSFSFNSTSAARLRIVCGQLDSFSEKYDLLGTDRQHLTYSDYYYTKLILDSSLFILAGALRKLFTESLVDDACDHSDGRLR